MTHSPSILHSISSSGDAEQLSVVDGAGCKIYKFRDTAFPNNFHTGEPQFFWFIVRDTYVEGQDYGSLNSINSDHFGLARESLSRDKVIVIPRVAVLSNPYEAKKFESEDAYLAYLIAKLFNPIRIPLLPYYHFICDDWHPVFPCELNRDGIQDILHRMFDSDDLYSTALCWWDWNDVRIVTEELPRCTTLEEHCEEYGLPY
jgi:hypothetical protein